MFLWECCGISKNTFIYRTPPVDASTQIYQKETPTKLFSCEISEIFMNTFSYRTPPVAASNRFMGPAQAHRQKLQ